MSIKCRIAVNDDINCGEEHYKSIYCHYDGHILGTGKKLIDNYNNFIDACSLVNIGDINYLHCTLENTRLGHFTDMRGRESLGVLDLLDTWNTRGEEYLYVFAYGNWYVFDNKDKMFHKLKNVLNKLGGNNNE